MKQKTGNIKKSLQKHVCRLLAFLMLCSICSGLCTINASAATSGLSGDGLYTLTPACAPKTKLDVSGGSTKDKANVQIYTSNNTSSQRFYLTSVGGGYYIITAQVSGKVLDVKGSSKKSGANVYQYTYKNQNNQVWLIQSAGNGYYYIKPSNNTKLALDVYGGGTKSGTNVQVYTANGSNAQKWKLTKVKASVSGSTISSIKKYSSSSSATFNVQGCDSSSKVKIDIGNQKSNSARICLESSSKVSVRIVSSPTGKVIVNTTFKGSSKTFTIPSQYKYYTVYVTKYMESGSNWFTQGIADGNNWLNLGNCCQISLTNAKLR